MAELTIDLSPIMRNAANFGDAAEKNSLELTVVTKFCSSFPGIVRGLEKAGVRSIADSNMNSFAALADASPRSSVKKTLLKTRLSDIKALSSLPPSHRPDRVFTSDTAILGAIREMGADERPAIILIAEAGDLKEGMYPEDILKTARRFADLPISGISANFACLSGRIPDESCLRSLSELAKETAAARALERPFLSVGGTVLFDLLSGGALKGLAAEIRIGEGIFFGYDSSGARALPGLEDSAFALWGEIMEVGEKAVADTAGSGRTALGKAAVPGTPGRRKRAVLDFGILACDADDMASLEPGVEIVGQTFDYTVVDVSDSALEPSVGELIGFRTMYAGTSRAFLNHHVHKR